MAAFWYLTRVLLLLILEKAWGQYDVFTTCPAVYTVGQLTPIRCTIDSAKVTAAQCSVIVDTVQFYLTENGVESLVCSATYPPSTCTPASSGKKCECVKQEGDIFTFQFEFVPNSTDESEKLRCQVICLDSQNLNQGPACAEITFTQTTTQSEQSTPVQTTTQSEQSTPVQTTTESEQSTPVQTTTESEQSTPGTAEGTGSLNTGQIVGIVVGVIAAVCVAAANAT